jgi:hypothetical protein
MNTPLLIRPGFESGKLWSLWDIMIKFDVRLLMTRLSHIKRFEESLKGNREWGMPLSDGNSPDLRLNQAGMKWLWAHLGPLQDEIKPLDLRSASIDIMYVWSRAGECSAKELATDLKGLRWKIEEELRDLFFIYLDAKEAQLFDNKAPFGDDVLVAFPSTNVESCEAAQCFALGRHTACVFHCMRVLESGLRVMAADVSVNFDIQNWQNVIDQIESEVLKLGKKLPRGSEKTERMQLLSGASKEFTYFKDGWRNHVAHNRSSYDGNQAESILNHTKAFMGSLAKWMNE